VLDTEPLGKRDEDEAEELAALADDELLLLAPEVPELSPINSPFGQTFLHITEDLVKVARGIDLDRTDFDVRDEVPLDRNFCRVLQLNSPRSITTKAMEMLVPGVEAVYSNPDWTVGDVEALPSGESNDWGIYMILKEGDAGLKAYIGQAMSQGDRQRKTGFASRFANHRTQMSRANRLANGENVRQAGHIQAISRYGAGQNRKTIFRMIMRTPMVTNYKDVFQVTLQVTIMEAVMVIFFNTFDRDTTRIRKSAAAFKLARSLEGYRWRGPPIGGLNKTFPLRDPPPLMASWKKWELELV
jgi:hypothetical protein